LVSPTRALLPFRRNEWFGPEILVTIAGGPRTAPGHGRGLRCMRGCSSAEQKADLEIGHVGPRVDRRWATPKTNLGRQGRDRERFGAWGRAIGAKFPAFVLRRAPPLGGPGIVVGAIGIGSGRFGSDYGRSRIRRARGRPSLVVVDSARDVRPMNLCGRLVRASEL